MILAVDLGTGSLKAGLFSPDCSMMAQVRLPYETFYDSERGDFDPHQWEIAFGKALKALPAVRISALAFSGNGPTLLLCDADGEPLTPAYLWMHKTAYRIPDQNSYYLPKVNGLKSKYPEAWEKTRWVFSCPEWLQFRLTGNATMHTPNRAFQSFIWDDQQLEAYDFPKKIFPPMIEMGKLAGKINADAARRFGLSEGLPVAAVGSDFMAVLLGSGTVKPGMVCDRTGTSEGINYCCAKPSGNPRLRDLPHLVEGLWNSAAILPSSGGIFEWYRRITGQIHRTYKEILSDIAALKTGAQGPLFFPGSQDDSLWDFDSCSFQGLDFSHGPVEMGRAVIEAIGFSVRRGGELLEGAGMPMGEMLVSGGHARSAVWNQIKADITGYKLLIPAVKDAELAGCAACAALVLGRAESLLEAAKPYVQIQNVVEPRSSMKKSYDEAYHRYQEGIEGMLNGSE